MKILLLNAPPLKRLGIVGQIYPPLGILYLAAYLKKYDGCHDLKVIDGYHERDIDDIVNKITSFAPDILGISFSTQAATGAYAVIDRVKKEGKKTFIVVGGPHPSIYPHEPLVRSCADSVVIGEGEVTFLELVKKIKSNSNYFDLAGVAYRNNGVVTINEKRTLIKDLDSIPFPARDLLDIRAYPGYHYKKANWDTSYVSARGCPYNCVYCSNPVWKSQKPWIRFRSPGNIAEEISQVKSEYGVREFYDQTDLFNADLTWSKKVCDEFIKRQLGIHWKVQMTVKNIDEELACKMVSSGCWLGLVGIETGNDATARGINKKTSRENAEKSLSILKKCGMKTFGLFMAFNVWEENGNLMYEDRAATMKTFDFAKEMIKKKKLDIMSWSLTTPYPGSELFKISQRFKLIPEKLDSKWEFWDSSENFILNLPGVSERDWRIVQKKGKILQAMLLFRSGTFNLRSIPIYLKKIKNLLKIRKKIRN